MFYPCIKHSKSSVIKKCIRIRNYFYKLLLFDGTFLSTMTFTLHLFQNKTMQSVEKCYYTTDVRTSII